MCCSAQKTSGDVNSTHWHVMFYDLFVKTVHQVRRECSSSTTYGSRTRVRDGHVALHSNLLTTSQPHAMTLAVGLPNAIEAKLRV